MKNLKELSIRIKNIQSIQKTTKIMQMISATKLSQNQKKLSNLRLYISKLHDIIYSLSQDKRLSDVQDNGAYLLFIVASDRGLCGNFNFSLIKFSQKYVESFVLDGKEVDIIFIGKKAFDIGKNKLNFGINILKAEESKDVALERVNNLINDIDLNKYSKIKVFYNKFYNVFTYKPTLEVIKPWNDGPLPIDKPLTDCPYEYEPNDHEFLLNYLIQDYMVIAIYSALLENATSENSARMVAMESANRNTKEMINQLSLSYNRSRQAAITTDLIEIISGAEFL